jgi:hypothetical protein
MPLPTIRQCTLRALRNWCNETVEVHSRYSNFAQMAGLVFGQRV